MATAGTKRQQHNQTQQQGYSSFHSFFLRFKKNSSPQDKTDTEKICAASVPGKRLVHRFSESVFASYRLTRRCGQFKPPPFFCAKQHETVRNCIKQEKPRQPRLIISGQHLCRFFPPLPPPSRQYHVSGCNFQQDKASPARPIFSPAPAPE